MKYEKTGNDFWIEDEELGIDISDTIEFIEKNEYPSGILRVEAGRKEGNLHGPSTYYAANGRVLSKTWYFEGKRVGKAYRYYPTGQVYSIERYFDGKAHLLHEYFYLDGTYKTLIHYKMGKLDGETKLFYPDGTLKRKAHFEEGEEKDGSTFYDEEGNPIKHLEKALS